MLKDIRYKDLTQKQVRAAELLKEKGRITFRGLQEIYSSRSAAKVAIDRLVLFGIAKWVDCGVWEYAEKN